MLMTLQLGKSSNDIPSRYYHSLTLQRRPDLRFFCIGGLWNHPTQHTKRDAPLWALLFQPVRSGNPRRWMGDVALTPLDIDRDLTTKGTKVHKDIFLLRVLCGLIFVFVLCASLSLW